MEKDWYFHVKDAEDFLMQKRLLEEKDYSTELEIDGLDYTALEPLPDIPLFRFSDNRPTTNFDTLGIEVLSKLFGFPMKAEDSSEPEVYTFAAIVRPGRSSGYATLEPDKLSNFEIKSDQEGFHEKSIPNFYRVGRETKEWYGRQTFSPRLMLDDRLTEIPVTVKVLRSKKGKVNSAAIYSDAMCRQIFKLELPDSEVSSQRYVCALAENRERMYMSTNCFQNIDYTPHEIYIPTGMSPQPTDKDVLYLTQRCSIIISTSLFQGLFTKDELRKIRCVGVLNAEKNPLDFALLLTTQKGKEEYSRQIVKKGDFWTLYTSESISRIISRIEGALDLTPEGLYYRLPCHPIREFDTRAIITFSLSRYEVDDVDKTYDFEAYDFEGRPYHGPKEDLYKDVRVEDFDRS